MVIQSMQSYFAHIVAYAIIAVQRKPQPPKFRIRNMKKLIGILLLCSVCSAAHSQTVLSLDSCRAMALRNNKELRIAR